MSHKVHPFIFRLGTVTDWKSRWFKKKNYSKFLEQDVKLRAFLTKKLTKAGLKSVEIEHSANLINIIVKAARPGLIIGRGGGGAEELKKEIKKRLSKEESDMARMEVRLEIEEVRQPSAQAAIIGAEIANQIEKRLSYRRVMKQAIEKVMQNKEVKGVKISVSGPLSGPSSIARTEWLKRGRISLQTLRSELDYAQSTAYTSYGTIGIKVWIYRGEVFEKDRKEN